MLLALMHPEPMIKQNWSRIIKKKTCNNDKEAKMNEIKVEFWWQNVEFCMLVNLWVSLTSIKKAEKCK